MNKKFLLAHDSEKMVDAWRIMLTENLRVCSYTDTVETTSSSSALNALKRQKFDAAIVRYLAFVFSDENEFYNFLLSIHAIQPNLPIIVVCGETDQMPEDAKNTIYARGTFNSSAFACALAKIGI